MCNTCNSCGCGNTGCNCNNGYDPLLAALTNLFTPLCGCGCRNNGSLVLVNQLGTVQTRNGSGCGNSNGCGCGNSNGCGCGNNNGNNGFNPVSGFGGYGNNNGCGCGNNNGCGCGNTYDAYYVRQYALGSYCNR